jgi:nicotinate-nucleotide adenylyltransferase
LTDLLIHPGGEPIGIYGGSFDPPHIGHVELVRSALRELDLGEVWILPAGIPVHRKLSGRADGMTRLHWLERIFAGQTKVKVLDWEVARHEPTPTIVSLRRFRDQYPHGWAVLLLGEDAYAGMRSWVEYPEHRRFADVAVFSRAGLASVELPEWQSMPVTAWRKSPGFGRCVRVRARLPDLSATDLRRRCLLGLSLRDRVPESIRAEVEKAYGPKKRGGDE